MGGWREGGGRQTGRRRNEGAHPTTWRTPIKMDTQKAMADGQAVRVTTIRGLIEKGFTLDFKTFFEMVTQCNSKGTVFYSFVNFRPSRVPWFRGELRKISPQKAQEIRNTSSNLTQAIKTRSRDHRFHPSFFLYPPPLSVTHRRADDWQSLSL